MKHIEYVPNAYEVDYDALYRDGIRALLFDIDYTLVPHGAAADERAAELIRQLNDKGFQILFISNNNEARTALFAKDLPVRYVTKAKKPLTAGYKKALEMTGLTKDQVAMIGDQLFTDALGARMCGIRTIWTGRVDTERERSLKLKSKIENAVLLIYNRDNRR